METDIGLDRTNRVLIADGVGIKLSYSQMDLIECLWDRRPNFVDREVVFTCVYGHRDLEFATLNSLVKTVRRKTEHTRVQIETSYGVGWRIVIKPGAELNGPK